MRSSLCTARAGRGRAAARAGGSDLAVAAELGGVGTEADPKEAARTGQVSGAANNPVTLIKNGRIHYRDIPVQQSLEDWNDFWSEYKNA